MSRYAALVLLVFAANVVEAQPNPGDYLVGSLNTSTGGAYAVDPNTGALSTLASTTPSFTNWVAMDFDNRHVMAVTCGGNELLRISPAGVVVTIAKVTTLCPSCVILDEDGTYAVTSGNSVSATGFHRVTSSGAVSTITSIPTFANGVALDGATGDYMIALWSRGELIRVDRRTLAITTLQAAGPIGRASAVDFAPRTGEFVVSSFGPSAVFFVGASGIRTSFAVPGYDHAVKVDDQTGIIHVAGFTGIAQYAASGTRIRTLNVPNSTFRWTSLDIYGSQNVSGAGSRRPGSTHQFFFSFPASGPGTPYVGVLSLSGTSPGIPVGGGRRINIVPDALALLMAQHGDIPGVTKDFVGQLGSQSLAIATLNIPAGTPQGLRIYCTAIAINAAMPSGLETGNTWGLTVE